MSTNVPLYHEFYYAAVTVNEVTIQDNCILKNKIRKILVVRSADGGAEISY